MVDSKPISIARHLTKFLIIAIFVALLLVVITRISKPESLQAITGTACPGSYQVTLSSGPTTGVTSGIATVGLYSSPSGTTGPVIDRVMFYIDGSKILGRGAPSSTSQYFWSMLWQSSVTANGPRSLGADVFHTNGFSCSVTTGPVTNVQNPTRTPIPIPGLMPNTWSGPTNYPVDFQLAPGTMSSAELRQFMQVEWSTNIGSVTPGVPNYIGRFFSGPTGGDGRVKARIFYGGEVKEVEAPVKITAFNNQTTTTTNTTTTSNNISPPTTTPDDSDSDGVPDSEDLVNDDPVSSNTPTSNSGSPTLTSQVLTAEGPIRTCLVNSIGIDRLKAIESEQSRPTPQEFEKYRTCFARQSFIVAQSLAPIAPDKVREKPETKKVEIVKAETLTAEIEGKTVNSLVFRGKAPADSTVIIYVFSEPLVLTTAANASGEWTYTLEDPLEPGDHEAYSLVETGDGDYERSSVFNFAVARAEASESNPNGFSLQLVGTATATVDNRSQNVFIASAVALIVITIVGLTIIIGRYNKHKLTLQNIKSDIPYEPIQQQSPVETTENSQPVQIVQTIQPQQTTQEQVPEISSQSNESENPNPPVANDEENNNPDTSA